MEVVNIGGRQWQKYKGNEGQDIYIAMFVEDEEKVLGQYVDDTSYDILIDKQCNEDIQNRLEENHQNCQ